MRLSGGTYIQVRKNYIYWNHWKVFLKNKEKNIALNFMEKYKKPKKYKNKT